MSWFEKIHHHAVHCSRQYKRSEYELVMALQAVDGKKVFRKMGYASLFEYAVKALKLPAGNAYAFINIARKSVQMPKITDAISAGTLSVSQAKRVLGVITPQTQDDWIHKASTLNQRELEPEVVRQNPKEAVIEKIQPVTVERSRLECGIDRDLEEKLERVKQVLSQKLRKVATLEDALTVMADTFLDKHDPLKKAARSATRQGKFRIHQIGGGRGRPSEPKPRHPARHTANDPPQRTPPRQSHMHLHRQKRNPMHKQALHRHPPHPADIRRRQ